MNVLVTGGAGFIGSNLCRRFINVGHRIVVVDNMSNGSKNNLKEVLNESNFELFEFDINDIEKLKRVFEEHSFDIVIHLAANSDVYKGSEDYHIDYKNTFYTTLNILEMMHNYGINKLFFASSSTVYGKAETRIKENSPSLRPISHYGAAKLASEAFISSFNSLYGIQVVIARFCNVVGPNMTHGVIPDLIKKLKSNPKELLVLGDGNQTKPYIYIDDLINGICVALEHSNKSYNDYLIGVDSSLTVAEITRIIMSELKIHIPIKYADTISVLSGDVCHYQYDVTKLRMLGWKPKYTAREAIIKAAKDNINLYKVL